MDYNELSYRLCNVSNPFYQAFLCLTYACLGRVGEIVRGRRDKTNTPLKKKDLQIKGKHLDITVLTEKTKRIRLVPVNMEKEDWLVNPILNYAEDFEPEDFLFNRSTRWGEWVFNRYFGSCTIHSLRVWRATHLLNGSVTGRPLPIQVVRRMGGWTSPTVLSQIYDQTMIEDYRHEI